MSDFYLREYHISFKLSPAALNGNCVEVRLAYRWWEGIAQILLYSARKPIRIRKTVRSVGLADLHPSRFEMHAKIVRVNRYRRQLSASFPGAR